MLTALGIATITIGIAEGIGELVVALGGDRLGKRNLALYGALLAGIGFLIVPTLTQSLGVALTGIFVVFVLIEASIVASITLFTELLPEARAVMMSANISASASGRLLGALVGGVVLNLTDSFVVVGAVTMVIVLVGCAFMWRVRGIH
jgi:predicted MFS family arabinose efflux permease